MTRLRLAPIAIAFTACGGDPEPPPAFDYCAEQHAADGVYVCDRAFPDHPGVHLPADVLGGDNTAVAIHAALDPMAPAALVLRDGTRVVLADAAGAIDPYAETTSGRVPDGFDWPSYGFLETVYEITGTAAHVDGDVAIEDAVVRPIVRLAPEVIDGVLAGDWEGTLSRRTGDNTYDPDARVAIRVRFTGYEPDHQIIPRWTPDDGQLSYALIATATIANATDALVMADGGCAPSLASLGDASPILETSADVSVVRVPGMHAAGDYQLTWNGGMGSILPVHPGALIQDAARDEFLVYSSFPHGTPNGMMLDDFHAVAAGGAVCTPP